jgi:hypothetical protein
MEALAPGIEAVLSARTMMETDLKINDHELVRSAERAFQDVAPVWKSLF